MSTTEWRKVAGFPYEVSNLGEIRSIPRVIVKSNGAKQTVTGGLMALHPHPLTGHLQVVLHLDGRSFPRKAHRLVLEAFVGPCPDGYVCRHLNGKPDDNRVENLAWGTPAENSQDCVAHGTNRNANKTHCPKGHPYSGSNLRINWSGGRACKACDRPRRAAYMRQYKARRRAAAKAAL